MASWNIKERSNMAKIAILFLHPFRARQVSVFVTCCQAIAAIRLKFCSEMLEKIWDDRGG